MTIAIFRFTTGEEIIGDVGTVGENTLIDNPCLIDTQIDVNGKVKTNLYPMALYSKDRIVLINLDTLMYSSEPTDEIVEAYQSRFNKIVAPSKKIILS